MKLKFHAAISMSLALLVSWPLNAVAASDAYSRLEHHIGGRIG